MNPLFDLNFLNELMNYRHREVYAKITLLTQNELPLQQIEGRVTGGSISIDGNSALRRTCNFSLVLKNQSEINKFHWALKQKFKLDIGLFNFINPNYPEIIWFKQGLFIITSCNMSQTVNNYTISLNGKDKMCLLNGDLSGSLPSMVDFGTQEYHDLKTDTVTKTKIPLKTVIFEAIHNYGGELTSNIVINDLDELGMELLEYRNDTHPLYGLRQVADGQIQTSQLTLDGDKEVYLADSDTPIALKNIPVYATMSNLVSSDGPNIPTVVKENLSNSTLFQVMKFDFGEQVGYRLTDLVYPGELIGNVGEPLTSVLDKIKNMLGEFEYFYNVDGKFVFQRKRKYLSTPWNSVETNSNNLLLYLNDSLPIVNFVDNKLVTSFANNPNLSNVKNDYSVWGTHKTVSGIDVPIHMRYAIDKKPETYLTVRPLKRVLQDGTVVFEEKGLSYYGDLYEIQSELPTGEFATDFYAKLPFTTETWDWRELIYQMALDFRKCHDDENFQYLVGLKNKDCYPTGRTGYEQYYTDLEGFWRLLYNPSPDPSFTSIQASEIDTNNIKDIYIQHPHRQLTTQEINGIKAYFDGNTNTLPIDPNKLFVNTTITITGEDGSSKEQQTFYPFIGSSYCCLTAGNTYYYLNVQGQLVSSSSQTILNGKDLTSLYINQSQELVVDYYYKEIIAKNPERLWVQDEKEILLSDLPDICRMAYMRSDKYSAALYNWAIEDNYGTLSTSREVSYPITYLLKEENLNYNHDDSSFNFWNKMVYDSPESLIFWFDFLDAEGSEISKYSVRSIGARTKALNDNNVKAIHYSEVPTTIFVTSLEDNLEYQTPGYTRIQLPVRLESLFNISSRGKSAKEKVDELLHTHAHCAESVSLNCIPVYYLEPNTQILIRDKKSNIDGEYLVSKITLPLTYNGTMNLAATKIISNL